ncbi:helix-turn-helix domain-containing protein [Streptococcus ferus]|uniref:winged helix-turn-helix domain-containing protein n=1 Tax=Streptococcus ferus TaxID=1345 RepID=UPI003512568E
MQYINRNTNENYTSINNAFLQDDRLEPATIGILAVILSNKPDWIVYPEEIARRLNISRRTVDRHFKILERSGYLLSVRISHGRGNGTEFKRFFSDIPMTDSYKTYLKNKLIEELSTGILEE